MVPSWDLVIIILFVMIAAMGIMLGRGKVLNVLVGSYVGYVAATEAGFFVHDLISTYSKTANISLFIVKTAIFFITIVVLNSKTELAGKGDEGSSVLTIIYAFLASGLMATSLLAFMEEAQRNNVISNSTFVGQINNLHFAWVIAPIIVLIFADFLKGRLAKK